MRRVMSAETVCRRLGALKGFHPDMCSHEPRQGFYLRPKPSKSHRSEHEKNFTRHLYSTYQMYGLYLSTAQQGETPMATKDMKALAFLIEKARGLSMSNEQVVEQRRSFAYGNSAFENERITRAIIDEEADKIGL